MFYVKFTGRTPYQGTEYTDYLAFSVDDIQVADLHRYSIEFAIENGRRWDKKLVLKGSESEKNLAYLDYLQSCIAFAHYEMVDINEFFNGIADKPD